MRIYRGIRSSRNVRGVRRVLSRLGVSSSSSRCLSILVPLNRDLGIMHDHPNYRISRQQHRERLVKTMNKLRRAHAHKIYLKLFTLAYIFGVILISKFAECCEIRKLR